MTALLKSHDRDLVKKKALLALHRFIQVDPGVAPEVERLLIDKIGYKVRQAVLLPRLLCCCRHCRRRLLLVCMGGGTLPCRAAPEDSRVHSGRCRRAALPPSMRPLPACLPPCLRCSTLPFSHFPCPLKEPSVMVASLCGLRELVKRNPAGYRNLVHYFTNILKQVGVKAGVEACERSCNHRSMVVAAAAPARQLRGQHQGNGIAWLAMPRARCRGHSGLLHH